MPSTYTLNNGIELIATGEQSGTWGDTTNTNLELLDTALDGQVTVTLSSAGSSGSPNTLPISDGAASNGRNRMVIFDDSSDLGATAYVQLTPNDAEKIIYVRNSLSGSRSILLFQGTYSASNDYEVPAGTTAVIFFDGAGSGAVAANVLSDLQVEKLSVFGTAPTITLTDTDTGVDTELNAASSVGQFTLNIDKNNEGSSPRLVTQISGTEFFRINESGAVFNESSNDQDFRVESNNDTHMLFVDASTSRIGLITSAPAYTLDVLGQGRFRTSDSSVELTVESTDTTAAQGAKIILNHNKTAADGDVAGYIDFKANNDGASEHLFGRIQVDATDVSAGSEDGRLRLSTLVNGSTFEGMRITTGTVFNEGGIDADFRVESSGNTHMLFVDAGNDRLGVGLSAPSATLDVSGDAEFESGKIVIKEVTGADAYSEIRKTNTGSNFAVVSPESIFLLIDSNNDQTNRGLVIGHNSALPGSSTQLAIIAENGTVFNEPGADVDFRVESDNNANMLFVNAGDDKVGIGTGSTQGVVTIEHDLDNSSDWWTNAKNALFLGNTNASGQTVIKLNNQTNTRASLVFNTSGTGRFQLFDRTSAQERLGSSTSETVMNEDSANIDFRVETDGDANMLFVDGGNNRVGISTGAPPAQFTVGGNDGNAEILIWGNNANTDAAKLIFGGQSPYTNEFVQFRYDSNGNILYLETDTAFGVGEIASFDRPNGIVVFNEAGNSSADFRVESNLTTHMLYVDSGNDAVIIGDNSRSTSDSGLSVVGTVIDNISIQYKGTTGGHLSKFSFVDKRDQVNARINNNLINDGSGTQQAHLEFHTAYNGTLYERLMLSRTEAVFNEDSQDVDFRVESNGNSNALLVDAGNETVNIGTADSNVADNSGSARGINLLVDGQIRAATYQQSVILLNRLNNDGQLVSFRQNGTEEGSISVSSNTVSYNGFAGRHESSGIPTTTAKGTVVSTIDELDVFLSGNSQGQTRANHAKVEVSNTVGDSCVYGVVDDFTDDGSVNVVSVGIAAVRVTGSCAKGDLLESNGDGTAKVQSDDIIRSKTIGKVTIGNSDTGVKLVPCVMYCG